MESFRQSRELAWSVESDLSREAAPDAEAGGLCHQLRLL